MKFKCCLHGKILKEPGALLFSPPYRGVKMENCRVKSFKPELISLVNKFHICKSCYKKLYGFMIGIATGRTEWPKIGKNNERC